MQEARRHRRLKIPLRIRLQHSAFGELETRAQDMSDRGAYVLLENPRQIALGELVTVTTLGLGPAGDEQSTPQQMRVVRYGSDGLGLELSESAQTRTEPRTAQLKQQLLVSQGQRYLLQQTDGEFSLPERLLQSNENWSQCLSALLRTTLQDDRYVGACLCYPIDNAAADSFEFLIHLALPEQVKPQLRPVLEWHKGSASQRLKEARLASLIDKAMGQS